MNDLSLFIPIAKVDEAQRLVYGIATAEAPDKSGEICDYATTKPYYETWSSEFHKVTDGRSLGNLRAMHGKVAVGKLTDIKFNDEKRQIEICAKVVDDNEWQKVVEGVYTGFSQGGGYVKRWEDPNDPKMKRYTARPSEVSLVDTPCLPIARFEYVKSDGEVEMRKFVSVEEEEGDLSKKAADGEARDDHGRWTANSASGAVVGAAAGAKVGYVAGAVTGAAYGEKLGRVVGAAAGAASAFSSGKDGKPKSAVEVNANILRQASAGRKYGLRNGAGAGLLAGGAAGAAVGAVVGRKIGEAVDHFTSTEKAELAGKLLKEFDDFVDLVKITDSLSGLLVALRPEVSEDAAIDFVAEEMCKYSPDESRDSNGRWTGGSNAPSKEQRPGAALRHGWVGARGGRTGTALGRAIIGAKTAAIASGPGIALDIAFKTPLIGAAQAGLAVASGAIAGARASNETQASGNALSAANLVNTVIGGGRTATWAAKYALRNKTIRSAVAAASNSATSSAKTAAAGVKEWRKAKAAAAAASAKGFAGKTTSQSGEYKTTIDLESNKIADYIMDLRELGVDLVSPEQTSDLKKEHQMSITNDKVVEAATDLAKAAGDETKWPEYIVAARDALEKIEADEKEALEKSAAEETVDNTDPVVAAQAVLAETAAAAKADLEKTAAEEVALAKVAADDTAAAEASAAVAVEEGGPVQVWVLPSDLKKGVHFPKKAEAIARKAELDTGPVVDPVAKLFDDIRIAAGGTPTEVTLSKADSYGQLRKYLGEEVFDASTALDALKTIFSVLNGEINEQENDPDQILALHDAANRLKDFIISEIDEDHSEHVAAALSSAEKIAGALDDLAKSGARNSASDKSHLQAIHDHAVSLGCDCGASKVEPDGGLSKLEAENAELRKKFECIPVQLEEINALVKAQADELQKLKSQPVPPPRLRVVEKGGDVVFQSGEKTEDEITAMLGKLTPMQRAEVMVKFAQQNPLTYREAISS